MKCDGKSVFKAYRKICDDCADETGFCAKCMDVLEETEDDAKEYHGYVNI